MRTDEKTDLERSIARARDGMGSRIDELDWRLRTTLDVQSVATTHAPKIIAGGVVVGFLVGFGFPLGFKKLLKIGVPLALVSLAAIKARDHGRERDVVAEGDGYESP